MAKAATKNVPATAGKKDNLPVAWQDRLKSAIKANLDQEASVQSGAFITTRAGQLQFAGSPFKDNRIDAVVVDAIIENAYYEDVFDPDNPKTPVCFAFGRDDKQMAPHEKSSKPQSETCAACPQNKFGTAEQGKGKACKNIRRLALVAAAPLTAEAVEKSEIAFLKIPVTSVKGWANYVRSLSALHELPYQCFVTAISTRPDPKSQFKIVFEANEKLPEKLQRLTFARCDAIQEEIMAPYSPPSDDAPVAPKRSGKRKF